MHIFEYTRDPKHYLELIEVECSDYLSEMKSLGGSFPLFRGLRNFPKNVYLDVADNLRKPPFEEFPIDEAIDKYLKKIGVKAKRLTGAYCTANVEVAKGYGHLFYVFPKNGFSYAHGTGSDVIVKTRQWLMTGAYFSSVEYSNYIQRVIYDCSGDLHTFATYLRFSKALNKFYEQEFLVNYNFKDNDLAGAIVNQNEIWFSGQHHLVKVNSSEGKAAKERFFR